MTHALFILGMHRSGTSALARVINLLGVDLGSQLMEAADDNEKGFFEHEGAVIVHEALLRELGQNWSDGIPLPTDWLKSEVAQKAAEHIDALIERDFKTADIWAVKDPRLSLLLPLWLPLLKARKVKPLAVVTWRNPLEVAASLAKRDGMDIQAALLCWLAYTLESLAVAQSMPYVIVSYDALMDGWQKTMNAIRTGLEIDWPIVPEQAAGEINAFLTPQLRHHKKTMELGDSPVEKLVARCLDLLQNGVKKKAILTALITDWHEHCAAFAPSLRAANLEILTLYRQKDDWQAAALSASHRAEDMAMQMEKLHLEHQALWDRLRDTEEERKEALVHERMAMNAMSQLRQELEGVYASQSWAITAPLRKLNAALQRKRSG